MIFMEKLSKLSTNEGYLSKLISTCAYLLDVYGFGNKLFSEPVLRILKEMIETK
jgi:hypothetical protein